jgi:uncharacterized protein YbjT (DUF2867 family)
MLSNDRKLIAVIGATGKQGGGVVRALQASGQFKVRALTRDSGKHRDLAEEVVEADLDRPETLKAAFEGAKGVSPIIGKKAPTNLSRPQRRYALPRTPASNILSGRRCPT